MYSVCFAKHILECGATVLDVLGEPLLGELRGEGCQGLCAGLNVSLLEVVGVGLIRSRQESPYPFFWRSAQARYGPQGSGRSAGGSAGDKGWEDEEVEEDGGLKVEEKRSLHVWMRGHAQHP